MKMPRGQEARRWKGDKASYVAKHMWLTANYPKTECEECGAKPPAVSRLEWANISGEYKRERSDYRCLCPSCHRKMDLVSSHCKNGHLREGNTRYNSRGHIVCKLCEKDARERFKERYNAKNH